MTVSPPVTADTGVKKYLDDTTTTTNKMYTDSAASPTLSDRSSCRLYWTSCMCHRAAIKRRRKEEFDMVSTDDDDGREAGDA